MHPCSRGLMTDSCAAACFRAVSASVPLAEEICSDGNNTAAFNAAYFAVTSSGLSSRADMVFTRTSQPMLTRSKGQARDDKMHLAELPKKRKASTRDAGSQINAKRVQTADSAVQDAQGGDLSKRASRSASMITQAVQLVNGRECSVNVKLYSKRTVSCCQVSGKIKCPADMQHMLGHHGKQQNG